MAKTRRLAAILFSDIVGYTALMEADEARAIAARDRHRAVLGPIAEQFQGELVEAPGDEALAVFPSSLRAVDCALAVQAALRDVDDLALRIGIHVGDVLFRDGEVIGEGVNVAARIRPLAEPGGICISGAVYQQVKNKRHLRAHPLGARALKNVALPVEVFALSAEGVPAPRPRKPRRVGPALAAGAALLLLAAAAWWLLGRQPLEAPAGHALAVLPFVNMSDDPGQAYFADGIAEELLNIVASFEELRVVGRTSSFSFRDSDADLKEIGAALDADVILEGSVRKAGDRVRITAQLIDAAAGYQLWSETYHRELEDIFAIQTDIATAIAAALRVQLLPEERERLATPPTRSLEAYQAYLLGRQRLARGTTAATEEAIGYFQKAIDLDPQLALAHAGLTEAYLSQAEDSGLPPEEMLSKAEAAAGRALDLDDRLAEAHAALGQVEWYANRFQEAESAFQRALALNPNSVTAYLSYANLLGYQLDRYEEALSLARRAVERDPLSLEAVMTLGETLNFLGRFDEALAWFRRTLEIDAAYPFGHTQIGLHHRYVLGRIDEATLWVAKALALDPRSQFNLLVMGWQFLDLGDPDRAAYWFRRTLALGTEGFYPNAAMQTLGVYRGDEAAVLEHGSRALALWPYQMYWVLAFLRDQEIRAGRYAEARALYEEHFPELLSEPAPRIDAINYREAIDLAGILGRTGEAERARRLLDGSLGQIQKRPRLGRRGYQVSDVQIHALRGDTQKAISALREAIDAGWRTEWWYWLLRKPDLEPLRAEPEFQSMLEEVRADMAAQLERVREMERSGELPPIPPAAAPEAA